jgi:hypothetical protein
MRDLGASENSHDGSEASFDSWKSQIAQPRLLAFITTDAWEWLLLCSFEWLCSNFSAWMKSNSAIKKSAEKYFIVGRV